jgi:hypothetical protein
MRAGSLSGSGTIVGNLINGSIIEIGTPGGAGRVQIQGNYAQSADGTLAMKIAGTDPGTGYDVLSITGSAMLDGTLDVTVLDGFFVHEGDTFTLLTFGQRSSEFRTINGLYPEGQKVFFDPVYGANDFSLHAVPY